jgi:hypothetical protein
VVGIAFFVTFGNESVERLFKYVSFFLYGVYVLFLLASLYAFGDRIVHSLAIATPTAGWIGGGIT